MENEEIFEIGDLEQFILYIRLVSYCNMELSINKETVDKKEELLDDLIEDSMDIIDSQMLEDLYSFDKVYEKLGDYLETDNITESMFITSKNFTNVVKSISFDIIMELFSEMEKDGKVELCWDKNKNDFVYRPKK